MFENAIETVSAFTRPICTITRTYGSKSIQPGCATLFFVNNAGWALTCRHVAQMFLQAEELVRNRDLFDNARRSSNITNSGSLKKLAKQFGFDEDTTFDIQIKFLDCVIPFSGFRYILHPIYDVALIKFEGYSQLCANSFPIFGGSDRYIKPGKMLCRLGYPFPEFSNYRLNDQNGHIEFTEEPFTVPWFPNDGMITRLAADKDRICEFEMSTPGIKGQSGGPIFDTNGVIWGMQAMTMHFDLDFDANLSVFRNGKITKISTHSVMHVGRSIHLNILKQFMTENGVPFQQQI